jgi:GTP-binding protein
MFSTLSTNPAKKKVAFIGRSNVGKSSLLNYLLQMRQAKISKHPGRTKRHHIFPFNDTIDLVDMPGYGYAKVSKERRNIWDDLILKLLFEDPTFLCINVLVDTSIPPQKIDIDFILWLRDNKKPFNVIFTKIDKESQKIISGNLNIWKNFFKLNLIDTEVYRLFQVSALKKKGREEVVEWLKGLII